MRDKGWSVLFSHLATAQSRKDIIVADLETLTEGCSDTREEALELLDKGVESVIETAEMQLMLTLEASGETGDPDREYSDCGSGIALTDPTGGYNLMLMGNRPSIETLTRKLFFLEDDEEVSMEDIADAIGELVNVAAGTVKSKRDDDKPDLQLGLPLFLTGSGCIDFLSNGVFAAAQKITGPEDIQFQMIIIWQGSRS